MADSSSPVHHSGSSRDRFQGRGGDANYVNVESMLSSDLQDWLQLTNWHDIEHREKKLAHYRRKDTKEEQKTNVGKDQPHDEPAKKGNESAQATVAEATVTEATIAETSRGSKTSSTIPRHDQVVSKRPRARSTSPAGSHDRHTRYRIRDHPESHGMDHSQLRVADDFPTSRRRRLTTDSSGYIATERSGSDYHNPHNDRVDDARNLDRERAIRRLPKSINLGPQGTVRFFVMRSGSWNNIYDSMDDGIWATHVGKAGLLGGALSSGITVVLFFAVNHSHGFQGYALMKTTPSKNVRHPGWWHNVPWNISEPFEVEWINTGHVDSTHVTHIMNSLNLGLCVTRSSNGQELSYSAGRQMVDVLDSCARGGFKHNERIRHHA